MTTPCVDDRYTIAYVVCGSKNERRATRSLAISCSIKFWQPIENALNSMRSMSKYRRHRASMRTNAYPPEIPPTQTLYWKQRTDFGVAVWGKDFNPEDHAERLRKAQHEHYYPSVDVFLPVCREPTHLLDNTWKYVRALDYPNVTVHVLDDGAKEEVRQLAEMHGFQCESGGACVYVCVLLP